MDVELDERGNQVDGNLVNGNLIWSNLFPPNGEIQWGNPVGQSSVVNQLGNPVGNPMG